ncbi:hypothetical protein D9M73_298130 [compost metagenome]
MAGQVPLQLIQLAAVPHDHGDVAQLPSVVQVRIQDALRHVPQFVDRGRKDVALNNAVSGSTAWFRVPAGCHFTLQPAG